MSKKKNSAAVAPAINLAEVLTRLCALEEAVARSMTSVPTTEQTSPAKVDITAIYEQWSKSALLQALYPPQENGNKVYQLTQDGFDDEAFAMPDISRFWPSKQRDWCGVYLGGCEQNNERRRGISIPLLVKSNISFYNPQGLSFSSAENVLARKEALDACSCAIIDFGGDELCFNYTPGLDLVYLFAHGFITIMSIQFPASIAVASLKFDESESSSNFFGAWKDVTLRRRRQDYYAIIYELISVMKSTGCFTDLANLNGSNSLEMLAVNQTADFKRPHTEGIRISVLDRLAIYRRLAEKEYVSDIGEMMRIAFGMFLLCEMHTRDFMDEHMPEWTHLRGEFEQLRLRAEKDSHVITEPIDPTAADDRFFHLQACVNFTHYVSAIVNTFRHLD